MKTNTAEFLPIAEKFFTAYDANDVDGMLVLCADGAIGRYALAGGSPLQVLQLDDTTPVHERRVPGSAFPGGRTFAIFEGSGFWTWRVSIGTINDSVNGLTKEKRMVGASGFEPPASWSRTRCQSLLNSLELCGF